MNSENDQVMEQEPPVSIDGGKQEIIERFIDKVGKDRPDDARDDPPAIAEEIPDEETEDNTGDQVEEKKHKFSLTSLFAGTGFYC